MTDIKLEENIVEVIRQHWGRALASLTRYSRDLSQAEDALQDALEKAWLTWPKQGIPPAPLAWLILVAKNRILDEGRRTKVFETKIRQLQQLTETEFTFDEEAMDQLFPDERLELIFTCCHPAISTDAQVALTLKSIAGLTTDEVARAFLVSEITMAQRIVRAKRKIKSALIPYRVPPPSLWPERLESVLAVIYLIFNEGYQAKSGQTLIRRQLCQEAIRLAKMLTKLVPEESETIGLLTLMQLHFARAATRVDSAGGLVTLEDQDRSQWDHSTINLATEYLLSTMAKGRIGSYQIQAAIAAIHAQAESYADTDWKQIELLYQQLYARNPTPVIALNSLVAYAMQGNFASAIEMITHDLGHELNDYQPYHAALADLYRQLGDFDKAQQHYHSAIEFTTNEVEKHFLLRKIQEIAKH